MSDYQDSITTANKGERITAGSAAWWAKLTRGATALGSQEPEASPGTVEPLTKNPFGQRLGEKQQLLVYRSQAFPGKSCSY